MIIDGMVYITETVYSTRKNTIFKTIDCNSKDLENRVFTANMTIYLIATSNLKLTKSEKLKSTMENRFGETIVTIETVSKVSKDKVVPK
ncbi:uncharacterized protein T551_01666 [Pneumocystis jirovecii RU7]|uniref:Uncharacterized protein n=1 Tax=Pneumocystis jirovecii (strain RU7) TaxID=1408657 RepID=A0A0W4ZPT9_PNEJ7|nr:uncharacterized protein T551_01666 [Pneumocystis jirovecii RU7]KTW30383.1 hypothetical protein T551_01666 [Pneumocystis jirovecii RU7]